MSEDTPAVSPTGKAIIPPQWVPFLSVAVVMINGAIVAALQQPLSGGVKTALTIALATIAPLVALASPGLRRTAVNALLAVVAVGLFLYAPPSYADVPETPTIHTQHGDVTLHIDATPPLTEVRLTGPIVQLTPGLGVRGYARYGKLDAGVMIFGSALGLGTATPGYATSAGIIGCHNVYGVCLGAGVDLANVYDGVSGLFQGFTWRKNLFFVVTATSDLLKAAHFEF